MPTVFRQGGFRFFFYSNEGDPREPVHIHAMGAGGEAKLWLRPEVAVARSDGLDARPLRCLVGIVAERKAEIEGRGMSLSAEAVVFDGDRMWVDLSDGRCLGVPLAWFPRLLRASAVEREAVEISAYGLHWEALDEDVSVEGLLAGRGDQTVLCAETA